MKTTLATILIALSLCLSAAAQNKVTLLNIEPYRADTAYQGTTVEHLMFAITVSIDGMAVTGIYEAKWRWSYTPQDLVVGDTIDARIDGKKLVIKRSDGKEFKATIIRRERLQPTK
jgi:hypothetical protein